MLCFEDVIICHGDHHDDNAIILHMGKEKKRLRDGTLPRFLTPSDEALKVYENLDNDKGGRQRCQSPLLSQMSK
jgi:hypothetical protein